MIWVLTLLVIVAQMKVMWPIQVGHSSDKWRSWNLELRFRGRHFWSLGCVCGYSLGDVPFSSCEDLQLSLSLGFGVFFQLFWSISEKLNPYSNSHLGLQLAKIVVCFLKSQVSWRCLGSIDRWTPDSWFQLRSYLRVLIIALVGKSAWVSFFLSLHPSPDHSLSLK